MSQGWRTAAYRTKRPIALSRSLVQASPSPEGAKAQVAGGGWARDVALSRSAMQPKPSDREVAKAQVAGVEPRDN